MRRADRSAAAQERRRFGEACGAGGSSFADGYDRFRRICPQPARTEPFSGADAPRNAAGAVRHGAADRSAARRQFRPDAPDAGKQRPQTRRDARHGGREADRDARHAAGRVVPRRIAAARKRVSVAGRDARAFRRHDAEHYVAQPRALERQGARYMGGGTAARHFGADDPRPFCGKLRARSALARAGGISRQPPDRYGRDGLSSDRLQVPDGGLRALLRVYAVG